MHHFAAKHARRDDVRTDGYFLTLVIQATSVFTSGSSRKCLPPGWNSVPPAPCARGILSSRLANGCSQFGFPVLCSCSRSGSVLGSEFVVQGFEWPDGHPFYGREPNSNTERRTEH